MTSEPPGVFEDLDRHLAPDDRHRFFVALFRLPTHLPLRHGDTWMFEMAGDLGDTWSIEAAVSPVEGAAPFPVTLRRPQASIKIWQPTRAPDPIPFDSVNGVAAAIFPGYDATPLPEPATGEIEAYESIVEVVTQFARSTDDSEDRPLTSVCFDRCLLAVNRLITAIADATKDFELHAVVPEELDLLSVVASRPLDAGFDVRPALYMMNWRFPVHRATLTDAQYAGVRAALMGAMRRQPFLEYTRLKRAAQKALVVGDYTQTVILSSVAIEVFLNLLLRAMLIEARRGLEIPSMFSAERGRFVARLRRDYSPLLGGRWRVDDPQSPVGQWVLTTQETRHRVVHAGHVPTGYEARNAYEGSMNFESFVMDRVATRRYQFPKTALSVLGEPGLSRRRLWNRRMADLAAALAPSLPDFWQQIQETARSPADPATLPAADNTARPTSNR